MTNEKCNHYDRSILHWYIYMKLCIELNHKIHCMHLIIYA